MGVLLVIFNGRRTRPLGRASIYICWLLGARGRGCLRCWMLSQESWGDPSDPMQKQNKLEEWSGKEEKGKKVA